MVYELAYCFNAIGEDSSRHTVEMDLWIWGMKLVEMKLTASARRAPL